MSYRSQNSRYFSREQIDSRLTVGLVGRFAGWGSGRTLFDLSGYRKHGTLLGDTSWTLGEGEKRNAVDFGGTDGTVNMGTAFDFTTEGFSFGLWFRGDSIANSPVLIYRGPFNQSGYYIGVASTGQVSFRTNQSAASQASLTDTGIVAAGIWYHFAFVRNGTSCKIYVNGVDRTTTAASHTNPTEATSGGYTFVLGDYDFPAFHIYLNGRLDNLYVYNRAISTAEVWLLYTGIDVVPVDRRHYAGTAAAATFRPWIMYS